MHANDSSVCIYGYDAASGDCERPEYGTRYIQCICVSQPRAVQGRQIIRSIFAILALVPFSLACAILCFIHHTYTPPVVVGDPTPTGVYVLMPESKMSVGLREEIPHWNQSLVAQAGARLIDYCRSFWVIGMFPSSLSLIFFLYYVYFDVHAHWDACQNPWFAVFDWIFAPLLGYDPRNPIR